MAKGVLVVQSGPTEGREDEYNAWYDDVHLKEVLAIAGFTSARRFRLVEGKAEPYLATYEVEADDLRSALAGLGAAMSAGQLHMSDAITGTSLALYEQITER